MDENFAVSSTKCCESQKIGIHEKISVHAYVNCNAHARAASSCTRSWLSVEEIAVVAARAQLQYASQRRRRTMYSPPGSARSPRLCVRDVLRDARRRETPRP